MRLFFATGDSLSITPIATRDGVALSFMPINYGKTVWCTCEAVMDGDNRNFFGSDDGYVYYPDVNVVEEMADMMSASRGFETNVEVLNSIKSMQQSLLRLGEA